MVVELPPRSSCVVMAVRWLLLSLWRMRASLVVGVSAVSQCVSKGCAFHHSGEDFHSLLVEMHMVIHMMWPYIFVVDEMNIRNKCTASGEFHIISMNHVEWYISAW